MSSIDQNKKKWVVFHCSHQGASHKKANKVCQDAAFSSDGDKYAIAIVCDGHGSANYFRSDRGAKLAVEATKEALQGFMKNFLKPNASSSLRGLLLDHPDKYMRQLETNIIYLWRQKVRTDYLEYPFTSEELAQTDDKFRKNELAHPDDFYVKAYGSTLMAVVVYPGYFWFGLHIGDGKCVACYEDGSWDQPIPWDDSCFLNVTTSLCDEKAVDKFRYCLHTDYFPVALFVGSDGVDDSFASDEDLYGFYQELFQTFQEKKAEQAHKEIDNFLPILSEKGSGDDISVSGIIKL